METLGPCAKQLRLGQQQRSLLGNRMALWREDASRLLLRLKLERLWLLLWISLST